MKDLKIQELLDDDTMIVNLISERTKDKLLKKVVYKALIGEMKDSIEFGEPMTYDMVLVIKIDMLIEEHSKQKIC